MTFGQIIKKLRRDADMTQEQLAEVLSISGQAVSRWENDIAMPDISLLPALANLFDVTTDHLLGVDITKKEEKIEIILKEAEERSIIGYPKEAADIVRAGLSEFPGSYKLMHSLLLNLHIYAGGLQGDERKQVLTEVISIAEKILAGSTEDSYRHSAITTLCRCYPEFGETEKAERLAASMPMAFETRHALLKHVYHGDKCFKTKRDEIVFLIGEAIRCLQRLDTIMDDGTQALTNDEIVLVNKKSLALLDVLFEDGDYGEYITSMMDIFRNLSEVYAGINNIDEALDHLEKAVKIGVMLDSSYDAHERHTSLLFRGDEYEGFAFSNPENFSLSLLNYLKKKPCYDSILSSQRGSALVSQLEKYAANR